MTTFDLANRSMAKWEEDRYLLRGWPGRPLVKSVTISRDDWQLLSIFMILRVGEEVGRDWRDRRFEMVLWLSTALPDDREKVVRKLGSWVILAAEPSSHPALDQQGSSTGWTTVFRSWIAAFTRLSEILQEHRLTQQGTIEMRISLSAFAWWRSDID